MAGVRFERGVLPVPDPAIHVTGGDDGGQRGLKQVALLEHFGLQPSAHVLEIGCGLGRLAYELASYLDADGRYTGFDIAPQAITWLNEHYAPRLEGFRFDLLDVRNPRFHAAGAGAASDVRFDYGDAEFDIVCAFEVFMHLTLDELRNYLDEVTRVLRPGGVAVLTFMAIWENEEEPVLGGRPFVAIGGGVHTRYPENPVLSMGYRVELIRDLFRERDLESLGEIEGLWHSPWKERLPDIPVHRCDAFAVRRPLTQ
jgi:SAM-dependent methyltransferase